MKNQINNIAEIAAELVISGKATIENAFQMALELDNDMIFKSIEDIRDMQNGHKNEANKTQKAFGILMNSVYSKLKRKCDCDMFELKTDSNGVCKKHFVQMGFVRQ